MAKKLKVKKIRLSISLPVDLYNLISSKAISKSISKSSYVENAIVEYFVEKPVVEPAPVVEHVIGTDPIVGEPVVVPSVATDPIVVPVDDEASIYDVPVNEVVKIKPYEGVEVYGTYSDGDVTRPTSEYYQKQCNDKVLWEMFVIFENHNYPVYTLEDAKKEALETEKPVWYVVLMHARNAVEKTPDKIGHYENGANGVFGSISQITRCNLSEKVIKMNADIYLTRETNGIYIKCMYSPDNNGNPFWRVVYNMAEKLVNP